VAKGAVVGTQRAEAATGSHKVATFDYDAAGTPTLLQAFAQKAIPGALVVHAVVSATTTSGTLSAADDKIIWRQFTNNGTDTVYVCGDGGAATNQKQPIYPGTYYTDPFTTGAWTVIAASGAQDVHVATVKAV